MRDPLWMEGDDPDFCEDCGWEHEEGTDCPESDDPDRMWDELNEWADEETE